MDFIEKARLVHGDKYDYSLVEYKNNKTKVKIICKVCGNTFEQTPNSHLSGRGCKKCGNISKRRKTTEQFIKEAKLLYGDKYDYSLVEYKNNKAKVKIICNKCNHIFEQAPNNHLKKGNHCSFCNGKKKDLSIFIEKARLVHRDKYDYSLVEYKDANTELKIKCNKCGNIFEQLYRKHLQGQGCPNCKSSLGETEIKGWLVSHNINFKMYQTYSDLRDKKPLSYDFYLEKYNLLIEYNGIQHYRNTYNKPSHEFHRQFHHDWLKRKYAKNNGITLLVIPYWKFSKINEILTKLLTSK